MKYFLILIGVCFIFQYSNAQYCLGCTEDEIKKTAQFPLKEQFTDGGKKYFTTENPYLTTFYYMDNGLCTVYAVTPKEKEDYTDLLKMLSEKYTKINDTTWHYYHHGGFVTISLIDGAFKYPTITYYVEPQ